MSTYERIKELHRTVWGIRQIYQNDSTMDLILTYIQEELFKAMGGSEDED